MKSKVKYSVILGERTQGNSIRWGRTGVVNYSGKLSPGL